MANEERFTGLAGLYARYRPTYPAGCAAWLIEAAGLGPRAAVADVGAGTGIFSRQLLEAGLEVRAVEPNADMRAEALATLGGEPGFSVTDGSAEHTGLEGGSVRLVTCAQAFHWFDPAAFAAECRRILVPGGQVAVLWNTRDTESPLVREYEALRRARTTFDGWAGTPGRPSEGLSRFYGGRCQVRLFENPLCYDEEGFVGHGQSASYAPKEPAAAEAYLEALRAFFAAHAVDGTMRMPMVTEVYLGRPVL